MENLKGTAVALSVVLGFMSIACGGSSSSDPSATEGVETGGSTSAGGGPGIGGAGGEGGVSGAAGAAGASSCFGESHHAYVRGSLPDGRDFEFSGTLGSGAPACTPFDYDVVGAVTDTSARTLHLDTCPPNDSCVEPSELTLEVKGDAALTIPIGALVRFRLHTSANGRGCQGVVLISNEPEWAGASNPVAGDKRVWIAVMDGLSGGLVPFENAPFDVDVLPRGCTPPRDLRPMPASRSAFRFSSGQNTATVESGESQAFELELGGGVRQSVTVTNLRSYATGYTDDFWSYGYVVEPR